VEAAYASELPREAAAPLTPSKRLDKALLELRLLLAATHVHGNLLA
jgi:hypothetical protein